MDEARTISSAVDVEVDSETAFEVFTGEMDRWWVPGPINFFDSARALTVRCEPGVGGRLLEVYDAGSGDGLELARITLWEPPDRLGWRSSVDDVEVTVSFEPVEVGTRVTVEALVPASGRDEGGSVWVRVAPFWFDAWCGQRHQMASARPTLSRLAISVAYAKPAVGARWIHEVLGLRSSLPLPADDAEATWVEFQVGDSLLIVQKEHNGDAGPQQTAHVPWLFVDDVDEHQAHAHAAGADIVDALHPHGYRSYTLRDPEGNRWTVAQVLPSVQRDQ